MAYLARSDVKDSQICWNEVIDFESGRIFNNNNGGADDNSNAAADPCDFVSLCRVVNDLNAGFAILRSQVESVVTNLDLVSKSNHRIHEKVFFGGKTFVFRNTFFGF